MWHTGGVRSLEDFPVVPVYLWEILSPHLGAIKPPFGRRGPTWRAPLPQTWWDLGFVYFGTSALRGPVGALVLSGYFRLCLFDLGKVGCLALSQSCC